MYGGYTGSGISNVPKMDGIWTPVAHCSEGSAVKNVDGKGDKAGQVSILYCERGGEERKNSDNILMDSLC